MYRDRYLFYGDEAVDSQEEETSLNNINEAHQLIRCASGQLSANVEGVTYTLHPGDLLLLRDAEVHKVVPTHSPTDFQHVQFSTYYFDLFDPDRRLCRPFTERPLGMRCLIPQDRETDTLIEACIRDIAETPDAYMRRLAVFGSLTTILCRICRLAADADPDAFDSRSGLLLDIINYINSHLEEDLNPDKIAATLYISRSQLDRIFKQNLGFTLWKYVTFKRLIRARHLLHAGVANNEVAHQCGFGDYSTFYKVYTRIFGTAPRAAHPTDTTDPLLKQFYQFDESSTIVNNPAQMLKTMKRLHLD